MKLLLNSSNLSGRGIRDGFTIIEVVIVLALAAFIFTIVFFAVPQLQSSLRDNQHQRDLSATLAAILEYKAANGIVPTNAAQRNEFRAKYFDSLDMTDPSTGLKYEFHVRGAGGWVTNNTSQKHYIQFAPGRNCDSSGGDVYTSPQQTDKLHSMYAVSIRNDRGGGHLCIDNG